MAKTFDALKILEKINRTDQELQSYGGRGYQCSCGLSMKPESKQVNAAAGGSERHKTARDCTAGRCRLRGTFVLQRIAHALNQRKSISPPLSDRAKSSAVIKVILLLLSTALPIWAIVGFS